MDAVIIGLTGRAGAGKDTAFQRLAVLYPRVTRVAFADKLKDSVAALFKIDRDAIERYKTQPWIEVRIEDTLTPRTITVLDFREMLQLYGTESHRGVFGQDFWPNVALPLDGNYPSDTLTVVTDVRFDNEVEQVKKLGGYIVRIFGPTEDDPIKHVSEEVPSGIDYGIENDILDDGFANLDEQLREMIEFLEPLSAPESQRWL